MDFSTTPGSWEPTAVCYYFKWTEMPMQIHSPQQWVDTSINHPTLLQLAPEWWAHMLCHLEFRHSTSLQLQLIIPQCPDSLPLAPTGYHWLPLAAYHSLFVKWAQFPLSTTSAVYSLASSLSEQNPSHHELITVLSSSGSTWTFQDEKKSFVVLRATCLE